jgi:hypothetical protein
MSEKQCPRCGIVKQLSEYHKDSVAKDGVRHICRVCSNLYSKMYRESHREYFRTYNNTHPERLKKGTEYKKKHRAIHPDRQRSRRMFLASVKVGKIERQPCEVCGELYADGHHDDYSKPFSVRWLCEFHHRQHHGQLLDKTKTMPD